LVIESIKHTSQRSVNTPVFYRNVSLKQRWDVPQASYFIQHENQGITIPHKLVPEAVGIHPEDHHYQQKHVHKVPCPIHISLHLPQLTGLRKQFPVDVDMFISLTYHTGCTEEYLTISEFE
jgi:hypothetical protein